MKWLLLVILALTFALALLDYAQQPAPPTEYEEFGTYFTE